MAKEFFFSLFGHVTFFIILAILTLPNKKNSPKPYHLVYKVSLVSQVTTPEEPKTKPGVAVVSPVAKKAEPVKKQVEKPKTQPKSTGMVKTKAGLGARAEGFEYSYYLNVVLARIGENWINPYQTSNLQLKCTIVFMIKRDGTIAEAKIESGSKNQIYDQSCLRAVLATSHLPPLPSDFTSNQLKLHLEFEYKP